MDRDIHPAGGLQSRGCSNILGRDPRTTSRSPGVREDGNSTRSGRSKNVWDARDSSEPPPALQSRGQPLFRVPSGLQLSGMAGIPLKTSLQPRKTSAGSSRPPTVLHCQSCHPRKGLLRDGQGRRLGVGVAGVPALASVSDEAGISRSSEISREVPAPQSGRVGTRRGAIQAWSWHRRSWSCWRVSGLQDSKPL